MSEGTLQSHALARELEEKCANLERVNRELKRQLAERQSLDEHSRASEQALRVVLGKSSKVVWTYRPRGQWQEGLDPASHERWHELTGQTHTQSSAGDGWLECVHANDRHIAQEALRAIAASQPTITAELRVRRHDGEFRWLRVEGVQVYDDHHTVMACTGTATDITEQKQTEAALRLSEQKARAIFDQTFEFIGLLDVAGNLLEANQAAMSFAGIPVDKVLGRPFWETPWWNHSLVAQQQLQAAIRDAARGEFVRFETTHPAQDGSLHTIDFSLKPVRNSEGEVVWLIPEGRDISERKRTEDSIRTKNTLRAILLSSPGDEMFTEVLDFVRERFESRFGFFGYIRETDGALVCPSMTKDIWQQCAVDDKSIAFPRASWGGLWGRVLLERQALIKNEAHRTPSGHVPLVRSMGAPLLVNGELIGSIHVANRDRDYSAVDLESLSQICETLGPTLRLWLQRQNAEARREDALKTIRHLATFPEVSPNPVLEFSASGQVTYANPAARAMVETLGCSDVTRLLPMDTPRLIAECLENGKAQLNRETRHASRTISWSFYPVVGEQVVHCHAADITEHLLLEEKLRHSQKMDAIGQLAGGVAHDFNNILTIICGNAELLRLLDERPQARSNALDEITQAAVRAADLTHQLLAFSRRQVMEPRRVDLNENITALAKMLERLVGDDVQLKLQLHPASLSTRADPGMLDQVLVNLVVNARDAMPEGGSIRIETTKVEIGSEDVIRRPGAEVGPYVVLRVSDTGGGIPPQHLEHIFEPFFTTKAPGKGTGLGLATVFGIVAQHRGWVNASSPAGQGASFEIFLPQERSESGVVAAPVAANAKPRGGSESILVVEDEEPVGRLVKALLEREGYRVTVVPSGAEALRAWDEYGRVDLVLTDMIMPGGVSGRDLGRSLCATRPNLPVIYMSGFTGKGAGQDELHEGFNFLQKPFSSSELLACIRSRLDSTASAVAQSTTTR